MRTIGQLDSEAQARTLADYLFLRGIETRLEPARDGAWALWVVDEDQVAEAKALLSRFRSMPDAEEFYQATAAAERRRREAQRESRAEERLLQRPAAFPWRLGGGGLTLILQVLCVAAALATRFGEDAAWTGWLRISGFPPADPLRFWNSLAEVASGQVWRLITPVFLHFSILHLLFNLLWIQDLGTALEARIGTWRYAGLLAAVALVSNLCQYAAGGAGFGGLSGVVYGVFGYLWVRSRLEADFGLFLAPLTAGLLLVYLALGIFGLLGPTANVAHFSGLAAGAAAGWGAARFRRNTRT